MTTSHIDPTLPLGAPPPGATTAGVKAQPVRLTLDTWGMTDVGRVRPHNEDQFLIAELTRAMELRQSSLSQPSTLLGTERAHLLLVADGMGGHAAGETASELAVLTVEAVLLNALGWFFRLPGDRSVVGEFQQALRAADARIFEEAQRRPELEGMGTTLTLAFIAGTRVYVIHAGDSRCYLLREGMLRQVTSDHTLVAEMVQRGLIDEPAARQHELRNVVTNVVGGGTRGVTADCHRFELEDGDVLLLCSDGLNGMVGDPALAAVLSQDASSESLCRDLVALANEAGGRDNITAVVARAAAVEG